MMLNQIELYGPTLDIYLSMKPGISGKWQVSERNNVHFRRLCPDRCGIMRPNLALPVI